ncbi:MAG: MFS transporter, partial [Chloroflexota bacterium]
MELWTKLKNYPKIGLILLAYLAFIALGMPDGLLGVAWPSIRTGFNIPLDAIGVLLTASVAGYTTSGFFSGPVITRLGVGKVLVASCLITGLGLIGYTLVPVWWMMVALGVFAGLGAGAIDAGLNTYVASHFGEGLMQWLHASYGIGVTLGPIIMTIALTSLHSWHIGYQIVGGFQLIMATCFVLTLAMWDKKENLSVVEEPKRLTDYKTPMLETMQQSQVWLSVLLFFLYVGAEGTLGIWTYSLLIESRGVDPAVAGFWAGSYWATFTIGRVVAGLYAKRIGVNLLVLGGLGGAFLGSVLLLWNPFQTSSLLAVALIGFSVAPIFPALMSGTSKRVGEHFAANTIGLQMASTGLGMAAIPGLLGVLAKRSSLEVVPVGLVLAFAGLF